MLFSKLELIPLASYEINPTFINTIRASWEKATYRKSESQYRQNYKAMIWLEEGEQAKFLKEFNRNDIRLIRNPEKKFNIFCIKNDAS